eukprot:scaffold159015_cov52-Prasinocladus_malaysianus.AAC.1
MPPDGNDVGPAGRSNPAKRSLATARPAPRNSKPSATASMPLARAMLPRSSSSTTYTIPNA